MRTSVLLLLLAVGSAHADIPAWCGKVDKSSDFHWPNLDDAIKNEDWSRGFQSLVAFTCKPDDWARKRAAELEESRQKWAKRLDLNDADWADAVQWALRDQGSRNSPSLNVDGKLAWSQYSPIDQYAAIVGIGSGGEHHYLTDALGSRLTETGRMGYVQKCIEAEGAVVAWAMCQQDIDQLDRKKIVQELRGDSKHDGYVRMVVRIKLDSLEEKLKKYAESKKALLAKDAEYAKVFSVADQARKDWSKVNAKLADLALLMDDARTTNSRKAYEGCENKVWPEWVAAVSGIPAKKFTGFKNEPGDTYLDQAGGVLANDPDAYLASIALVICMSSEKKPDYLTRHLRAAMARWPGFRGPRSAAHTAIMGAGIVLDDRDAKLEYPGVYHTWLDTNLSSGGGGEGVIATIKPSGKTAVISFAPKLGQSVVCTKWKSSNRITQIRSDGTLVYQTTCLAEKTITVDRRPDPQTVNVRYIKGLKPGMQVSIVEDVVVAAWAKPGAKVPLMVGGAPLK